MIKVWAAILTISGPQYGVHSEVMPSMEYCLSWRDMLIKGEVDIASQTEHQDIERTTPVCSWQRRVKLEVIWASRFPR